MQLYTPIEVAPYQQSLVAVCAVRIPLTTRCARQELGLQVLAVPLESARGQRATELPERTQSLSCEPEKCN